MKKIFIFTVLITMLSFSLFGLTGYGQSVPTQMQTLPVQLSSFTAGLLANGFVQLQWTAETETNMLGYNVYRGMSNKPAEAISITHSIIPAYNKSTTTEYIFTDEDVLPGKSYFYWLQSVDLDLTIVLHGPINIKVAEDGEGGGAVPDELLTGLIGAYPNPFNPGTFISFSLSERTNVGISVYNLKGQFISNLIDRKEFASGRNHTVYWDGKDGSGNAVVSGIYLYLMETSSGYRESKKMLLMK